MDKRPRVLRHQDDEHFGSICAFFDTDKRRCTIYEARPEICRESPGRKRCGYYAFLKFERDAQEDPDYVDITTHYLGLPPYSLSQGPEQYSDTHTGTRAGSQNGKT